MRMAAYAILISQDVQIYRVRLCVHADREDLHDRAFLFDDIFPSPRLFLLNTETERENTAPNQFSLLYTRCLVSKVFRLR